MIISLLIINISFFGLFPWQLFLPYTPEGIDPAPIYNIKIDRTLDIIDVISNMIPNKTIQIGLQGETIIIFSSPNSNYLWVIRSLNIYQFNTYNEALIEYESYKQQFTRNFGDRLYKEKGNDNNKYFIIYSTIDFGYNHGIPYIKIKSPDILLGFLKNNLLIIISYSGYQNYDNFVEEINEDITFVSNLLIKSMDIAKPQKK